jgi:hypothetical protein
MRQSKVILAVSEEMEKRGEHNIVRLPRTSREEVVTRKKIITVFGNRFPVQQAYRKDLSTAGRLRKAGGKLPGFVSKKTFEKIFSNLAAQKESEVWVSESAEEIVLGCDPEFVFLKKDGSYAYAGDVLGFQRPFGSDGPLAELRPGIFKTAQGVVDQIHKLFEKSSEEFKDYKWLGGSSYAVEDSYKYGVGGHISLGRVETIEGDDTRTMFQGICKVLNVLVGVPLYRIEKPAPWLRRCDGGYGNYESFRYRGDKRMEWRVPGGYWLVHPDIALPTIAVTKAVTSALYNLYRDNKYKASFITSDLSRSYVSNELFKEILNKVPRTKTILGIREDPNVTIEEVSSALNLLKEFCIAGETYENNKDLIERFCTLTTRTLNCSLYLRDNWLENKPLVIE